MWRTIDILPSSLQGDPQVEAACEALDRQLVNLYRDIPQVAFWSNIPEQIPPLLDMMLWEYHVDNLQMILDGAELTIEQKRQMLDDSILWHQKKGTKWLLEKALQILYGDIVQVVEWYEYGGKPYFFKVQTRESGLFNDPEIRSRMMDAIMQLKNVRSWLEAFEQLVLVEGTFYVGIMNYITVYFTVRPHNA